MENILNLPTAEQATLTNKYLASIALSVSDGNSPWIVESWADVQQAVRLGIASKIFCDWRPAHGKLERCFESLEYHRNRPPTNTGLPDSNLTIQSQDILRSGEFLDRRHVQRRY